MNIFEKKFLTLEYNAALNCLIQHWKGFATSEEFREGCRETLEQFKKRKVTRLIANTKNFALVKREDNEWAAREITPMLVRYGLKHMAFIVPENVFSQLSVENFKKNTGDIVQLQYFDHLENAKIWFREVEEQQFGYVVGRMAKA